MRCIIFPWWYERSAIKNMTQKEWRFSSFCLHFYLRLFVSHFLIVCLICLFVRSSVPVSELNLGDRSSCIIIIQRCFNYLRFFIDPSTRTNLFAVRPSENELKSRTCLIRKTESILTDDRCLVAARDLALGSSAQKRPACKLALSALTSWNERKNGQRNINTIIQTDRS
jgi:hypothetical protein